MKKYYAYFYETGSLRKIVASTEEEAWVEAKKLFGEEGYTVGVLRKVGDPLPYPGAAKVVSESKYIGVK